MGPVDGSTGMTIGAEMQRRQGGNAAGGCRVARAETVSLVVTA